MYTLFLDTHGEEIIVSLYDGVNVIEKRQMSEYSHAKYLAPMIQSILSENELSVKTIKNIVAVNGPGSFTGLRIGLSAAKTLAYSLNVPIYLVSSLSSYLISCESKSNKLCVIEDNKGYYISVFDKDNNIIEEESYVDNLDKYKDLERVPLKIDVKKVVEYALKSEKVNPHLVRANYVKKIEVQK